MGLGGATAGTGLEAEGLLLGVRETAAGLGASAADGLRETRLAGLTGPGPGVLLVLIGAAVD